jgi:guanylate kinase
MNDPFGTLYVISAPSGAGKTSLVKALLEKTAGIAVSVSHTTRAKREGERDGVDYHFVDKIAFEKMVGGSAFLEHAQVFDNYYGTAVANIEAKLNLGEDVILEIDWQGAEQVRQQLPYSVNIFILPPSRHALEERLRGRGQDSADIINRRMRDAKNETSHYSEYDYLVVNDNFEDALVELRSIVLARRCRFAAQSQRLAPLLKELLA